MDASGTGGVFNPPGGRKGDGRASLACGGGAGSRGAAPRAGAAVRGLLELLGRGGGVVTPGTTSIGRAGDDAAGGGIAGLTGLGAGLGASGSVAGASRGGPSCAETAPAQSRTIPNDHDVTDRAIGQVSRYKDRMRGGRTTSCL